MPGQGAIQRPIALYIPSLSGGGAEMVTVRLANQLAAGGQAVDVVVNQGGGVFADQLSPAVRQVDLRASRTLAALPGLRRYLARENPSALVASLLFNNVNAVLARAGGRWRGRLILCQHNTFSVERHASRKDRVFSALFRRLAGRADAVVAVSEGVAQDFVRHVPIRPEKLAVIYNPIITADFAARAALPPEHPWFGQGREGPVLVAVGRLAPQKDYPTLLRALARLRGSHPARLIVLGEGALLGELKELAATLGLGEAVDFAGFRPNPLPLVARADALVLSSAFEGFGNVLAEALGCGTPVISTACNGPVEILGGGRWGEVVPVGDVAALAAAMARVLAHRPDPATLRAAAARFACEPIAAQYRALALGEGRGEPAGT